MGEKTAAEYLDEIQRSKIPFPLRIVQLTQRENNSLQSEWKRIDIAAKLYLDFQLEKNEQDLLAVWQTGVFIARDGHDTVFFYWLDPNRVLAICCDKKCENAGFAQLMMPIEKPAFPATMSRLFASADHYFLHGLDVYLHIDHLTRQITDLARRWLA
ncbi:MAG: hypothetical protein IJ662_00785 [Clostridia bacterium]|nr:hypothetical protein [Clostridia bacterium]